MTNNKTIGSLNEVARNKLMLMVTFFTVALVLCAVFTMMCNPVFADSFIGESGESLLGDITPWIALAGLAFGILQIVKGRMAIGIVGLVVAAVFFAFSAAPAMFGTFGQKIVNIFLGQ